VIYFGFYEAAPKTARIAIFPVIPAKAGIHGGAKSRSLHDMRRLMTHGFPPARE
jgi:hypothetical protein